ncbi:hypothetical protein [Mycobacterium riyadhense]|uniref:hypothetical protein n=1 Tax=Mycobacterium riyadhense TaxID=486698 RepID=UPI00195E61BD|nr:hypothetical protein [Mycobacterium riyadhense]
MSIEHLPSVILTATLLLRLAPLVGRRLRALIRAALLAVAALMLIAGPGHLLTVAPLLHSVSLH